MNEKAALNQQQLQIEKEKAEFANLEKSRFLANMSHEFRTPMHAIWNFSALALKHMENPAKLIRYLENIQTSSKRLTVLVDDLLDLSKLEAGKVQIIMAEEPIYELVEQAVSQISSLLDDKDLEVKINADQQLKLIVDKKLIIQALINLLSNAIKFSPKKSCIEININPVTDQSSGQLIQFAVIDEGLGIPEDEIDSIFDKFIQSSKTRTNAGGTGLGLSIFKEIVELHQGRVYAKSPATGHSIGSGFYFEIPLKNKSININNAVTYQPISWSEKYSVGNALLDSQHKNIIDLINRLFSCPRSAGESGNSLCRELMTELNSYINEHLRDEEKYLKENAYPYLSEHQLLHENFTQRISELSMLADSLPEQFLSELGEFLSHWWNQHILTEDRKYREYFESLKNQ